VSDDCPFDLVAPNTVECRGSQGACDLADNCDGVSTVCPADAKSTAECRGAAGVCDVAESCDGFSDDCPADEVAPATTECRGVAGVCDVAESCDGAGVDCPADAFEPATTVCRPDAGDCDVPESCTGSSADCPAEAFEADGTSCSDGNQCTLADLCVEGQCIGDSELCGDGVLQGGCGEECDDGGTTSGDGCSATCQSEPGLGCPVAPIPDCRRPFLSGKAQIQMKKNAGVKDFFKWKWLKGARTTFEEYGDPVLATYYQACIYDASGLRMEMTVPHGDTGPCAAKPCWKPTGVTGYVYKDKELTPEGVQKLQLKAGALGKAKIQLTARGTAMNMPDLSTLTQPLTVQIQNSNGICWDAVYSSPPTLQSATQFKDKAD
jgi:cysteine-rich repeat protein